MKEKSPSAKGGDIWQITAMKVFHGVSVSFSQFLLIKQFVRGKASALAIEPLSSQVQGGLCSFCVKQKRPSPLMTSVIMRDD